MTTNFTKTTMPKDGNSVAFPLTPAKTALATTYSTTISSSTTLTLNASTSLIEVSAISQSILMHWGATASTSAFDNVIQAGSTRHFVVPVNTTTGNLYTTVQFIEQSASATLLVTEF